jgi:pimeloyl-ACP methyl ester carboxylesterase
MRSALAKLARSLAHGAVAESLSGALLTTIAGHQTVFGLFEGDRAGDCVRRWRPGDRLPVLFCHGYMGDRTNFTLLRRRLYTAGYRSQATASLRPFWRSCDDYARLLASRAEDLLDRTGAPALDIVAHSMGGLAARGYLARLGGAGAVRRLVTLGTPHRGTLAGLVCIGAGAVDLLPGSPFLRALDGDLEQLAPEKVLSIAGDVDAAAPPSTCAVPWPQRAEVVTGLGHLGILCSRRVTRAIVRALPPVQARIEALEPARVFAAVA